MAGSDEELVALRAELVDLQQLLSHTQAQLDQATTALQERDLASQQSTELIQRQKETIAELERRREMAKKEIRQLLSKTPTTATYSGGLLQLKVLKKDL